MLLLLYVLPTLIFYLPDLIRLPTNVKLPLYQSPEMYRPRKAALSGIHPSVLVHKKTCVNKLSLPFTSKAILATMKALVNFPQTGDHFKKLLFLPFTRAYD